MCCASTPSARPYFMAAKFDAAAAVAKGFKGGDGIPVDLTIPTREPWVPLRILATGEAGQRDRERPTCSC